MNESIDSITSISDRESICELIHAWAYHRDRGNWEKLKNTFWPEGTISISWFDGPFQQFVDSSREMADTGVQSKHIIADPFIKIIGHRAVSEANVTMHVRFEVRRVLWKRI